MYGAGEDGKDVDGACFGLLVILAEQGSTPMHPVALDVPFIPPYGYDHMNDGFPRCQSRCELSIIRLTLEFCIIWPILDAAPTYGLNKRRRQKGSIPPSHSSRTCWPWRLVLLPVLLITLYRCSFRPPFAPPAPPVRLNSKHHHEPEETTHKRQSREIPSPPQNIKQRLQRRDP